MIILDIPSNESSTKARVSREILKVIGSWNKNSLSIDFENSEILRDSIFQDQSKVIVSLYGLPLNASKMLKDLGFVQIIIGRNDDLLEYADIFIDPLEPKSFQHFFGTDFLPVDDFSEDILEEIIQYFGVSRDDFFQKLSSNRAKESLSDILQVFKLLDWDSDFFGFNIGYVSCRRLTGNIESYIRKRTKELNIDMIQYNCNCHDQSSILTAEKNGYSFVDVRVTFEMMLKKREIEEKEEKLSEASEWLLSKIDTYVDQCKRLLKYVEEENDKRINSTLNRIEKTELELEKAGLEVPDEEERQSRRRKLRP